MRLFQLAKRWAWDPASIDFSRDLADWQRLSPVERELILQLTALFQAGEEAVTLDLLPLIQVIAREGRLEEEIYLTSFLFEEAKHVEFFARFLSAIQVKEDLHRFHTPNYRRIFYQALPEAMGRLATDPSPQAQAAAAVTYNIIVEGLLAETGYHAYFTVLRRAGIMPGLCAGIERTKNDESRHIAWGIYHLSRLVAAEPALMDRIHEQASELMIPAIAIITDIFDRFDEVPFGLSPEMFVDYATDQFMRRMAAIERAAGKSVREVSGQLVSEFGVDL